MSDRELIESMKRLKVQTGSLACLGCAHEDNCGIHGCAILREMIAWLERTLAEGRPHSVMEYKDRDTERGKRAVEDASPYAAAIERQAVGGGVPDAPSGTQKVLGGKE